MKALLATHSDMLLLVHYIILVGLVIACSIMWGKIYFLRKKTGELEKNK